MSELSKVLLDIDPETYKLLSKSLLMPINVHRQLAGFEQFVDAGKSTLFSGHRQALIESAGANETEEEIKLSVFGGSVACVALLKLPNASEILGLLSDVDEPAFNSTLCRASEKARYADEEASEELVLSVVERAPALLGVTLAAHGLTEDPLLIGP
jgi:hypothetical protein